MNKRKIILLATALCLVAILAVGGTLAYFTDTDNATNVFTIGHVNIELIEQQRDRDNEGQPIPGSALEAFEPNKPLYPIVGSAQGAKDAHGLPIAGNYVDKIITIKNLTDSQNAWVRVYVAIPSVLDNVKDAGMNVLHFNIGNAFTSGQYTAADHAENWGAETLLVKDFSIDGINYNVYYRDYNKYLAAGEETGSAAYIGFYLDKGVDYVNAKDGEQGYYTINGEKIDGLGTTVSIPVFACGVQKVGFESCAAAMTDAFGADFNPWAATK